MNQPELELYEWSPEEWVEYTGIIPPNQLMVELFLWKEAEPELRPRHFWNIVSILWPEDGETPFYRHPWAERMVELYCLHNLLSVAGNASSGKSGTFAVIGIVEFISSPTDTKVLITSTSKGAAKGRIWASVNRYWNAVEAALGFGKLIDYQAKIEYVDQETGKRSPDCGLELIACEPKKDKQAIGKLIGFKNANMVVIADELPELSEALLVATKGNLSSNPYWRLVGLGNPNSYYDAFGVFSKPVGGWEAINQESEEWETEYGGYCLRLDVLKSPNILAGEKVYDFMPGPDWLEQMRKNPGINSPTFWRMARGFWSPTGTEDSIYSEADIAMYGGTLGVTWGPAPPVRLAALDPSFTFGGDSATARICEVGLDTAGLPVVMNYPPEELHPIRGQGPPNVQVAHLFKEYCEKHRIAPQNTAVDATGGGQVFCDILAMIWSNQVLQVPFNGAATERIVSPNDPVPGNVRYKNRVSQLWFAGVDLLRNGQLKGLDKDTIQQMIARKYEAVKTNKNHPKDTIGFAYEVEPKNKMKARIGTSPDKADALFVLLELAFSRHKLVVGVAPEARRAGSSTSWESFAKEANLVGTGDFLY